ncbi:thioredoxin-dependent thiol peroxidase [Anaerotalea alkaliphila]|uniref:thioredoxin-dependent peroxiredoxin n=1 Tax=Anaerotalea alkaliphila TaxID=2662126 RepID=A0A7X5KLB4_9FIRM|nr:thioredoxin-dependent thiol peroxidase [Anaerotalea alkaliphila]NDL66529.1 thioredoxin-dependent thiol peroxidase [Anaerotalea alkaliphila]
MDQELKQGDRMPAFTLPGADGGAVSSETFQGKPMIVYFYPKDNTPGCTKEACGFRDLYQDFENAEAVVVGISKDSPRSHRNFREKHDLPFLLLSDESGEVCERFGVWRLKKNYGRESMGIVRSTFLVDGDGIIVRAYRNVKVEGHVEQVLADLRAMKEE